MMTKTILDINILAKEPQIANESLLQNAVHLIIEKKNSLPVTDEIMVPSEFSV